MNNDGIETRSRGGAPRRLRCEDGYSLIEVIIVIAIVGVLISVAIPNMLSGQQGFQMSSGTASVAGRLSEARTEALKRNREIVVTLDAGNRSVLTTVTDAGGVVTTLAGPDYLPSGVVFDLNGNATLPITFDAMGRPLNPPQAFGLTYPGSGLVRTVTVLSTGRVTVQ